MDAFIADQPSHRWWLRTADVAAAKTKAGRLATSAAEARSLACLFALECLARLPPAQIALCGGEGSSGAAAVRAPRVRAQRVLRFALDQATTACRLAEGPAADCVITVGKVHSREQHLQVKIISHKRGTSLLYRSLIAISFYLGWRNSFTGVI